MAVAPGQLVSTQGAALVSVASSGESGELVLTTLGRHGSPLLRYRTGDLARAETSLNRAIGLAPDWVETDALRQLRSNLDRPICLVRRWQAGD